MKRTTEAAIIVDWKHRWHSRMAVSHTCQKCPKPTNSSHHDSGRLLLAYVNSCFSSRARMLSTRETFQVWPEQFHTDDVAQIKCLWLVNVCARKFQTEQQPNQEPETLHDSLHHQHRNLLLDSLQSKNSVREKSCLVWSHFCVQNIGGPVVFRIRRAAK